MSERSDHEAETSQPDECSNTLDPTASHQIRCSGCKCLLAYPPDSLYIQCPRCLNTMDPRQPHQHQEGDADEATTRTTHHAPSSAAARAPPQSRPKANSHHSSSSHHTPMKDTASSSSGTAHGGAATPSSVDAKKRRDPNAPKAVCNAYMVFCKIRRSELKSDHPELPFGQIGARLGEIWRNMTPDEKQPYEDRASVDRERYRREMVDYTAGLKSEKRQKTKLEQSAGSASAASTAAANKKKAQQQYQQRQQQHQSYEDEDDDGEEYGDDD